MRRCGNYSRITEPCARLVARVRSKLGTVTIAGKPGVDIPPGTLNSILKQPGLEE